MNGKFPQFTPSATLAVYSIPTEPPQSSRCEAMRASRLPQGLSPLCSTPSPPPTVRPPVKLHVPSSSTDSFTAGRQLRRNISEATTVLPNSQGSWAHLSRWQVFCTQAAPPAAFPACRVTRNQRHVPYAQRRTAASLRCSMHPTPAARPSASLLQPRRSIASTSGITAAADL